MRRGSRSPMHYAVGGGCRQDANGQSPSGHLPGSGTVPDSATRPSAFDTLLAVNFPEVRDAPMAEFATIFGRALQHQEPVGRMFGGVNKRLVKQFRMPGYLRRDSPN